VQVECPSNRAHYQIDIDAAQAKVAMRALFRRFDKNGKNVDSPVPAMADIGLSLASRDDKSVVASYLSQYLAEFGFGGTYPYFDQYWLEPARHPLLIRRRGKPAGFTFVRDIDGVSAHEIAEFYVAPEHRGSGVGRGAVEVLLPMFPGRWRIPVQVSNRPGIGFWSRVLGAGVPDSLDGQTVVFFHGEPARG
jgi:predicted acetyltransferase